MMVADLHHFNADLDLDLDFYFNADPDPTFHQNDVYLPPLVYKTSRAPLQAFIKAYTALHDS